MQAISTITSVLDVEAGHLEVDPHQSVVALDSASAPARGARYRLAAHG